MRRKVIAGNWKMNMLPADTINFIEGLAPLVKDSENEVILCVPYTDLFYALLTAQNTNIKIGAQNMHWKEKGAYTGEISGQMLKSIGVEYVIIGHSERRQYFAETDETVNLKVKSALENNLKPIICVGETLEQRENGTMFDVVAKQLDKCIDGILGDDLKRNIVIAYEPIWAIGTGKTASSEDANKMCHFIRKAIETKYGASVSERVRILYGGSVKPSNASEILNMEDIDGALVGGASLKNDFVAIVNYD